MRKKFDKRVSKIVRDLDAEVTKLSEDGQNEAALEKQNLLLEFLPNDYLQWAYKSMILYALKRYDECQIAANTSINLNKGESPAWLYLGFIAALEGHYETASKYTQKAVEFDPCCSLFTILASFQKHYDIDAARKSIQRALEIDSEWSEARDLERELRERK